ncbi:MAG: DUF58 domain-containing protein [Bradymonadaceae bacterium]
MTTLDDELLEAVERLEIVARRAVDDELAGQYQSVFKGRGIDFADVREYEPGDDIRVIDWNVSARMNDLHVKQYVEERQLTVFLLVDASSSQDFASRQASRAREAGTKRDAAAELSALIAFSAISTGDRVGLVTFTDEVETVLPPESGRKHVLQMLSEIEAIDGGRRGTDIDAALERVARVATSRSLIFVVSDFLDEGDDRGVEGLRARHELVPVFLTDPMEFDLPDLGVATFRDPETGERLRVDTSDPAVAAAYERRRRSARDRWRERFRRQNIRPLEVSTADDHVEALVDYFRVRGER